MTGRCDDWLVSRPSAAAIAASVVLAAALAAQTGAAAGGPGLPPGWTHVSVNVIIRRVPYTLVYDRGRVIAVTATSLTLRERDGSVWVINVSPTALIRIGGQPGSLSQIRPLEIATTLSVDGAAASKVSVQVPPRVAAAIQQGGA